MRSDFLKKEFVGPHKPQKDMNRPYKRIEEEAGLMSINRQCDYGYRGTTPNYYLGRDIATYLKNS